MRSFQAELIDNKAIIIIIIRLIRAWSVWPIYACTINLWIAKYAALDWQRFLGLTYYEYTLPIYDNLAA
jgi:hypothetical protein